MKKIISLWQSLARFRVGAAAVVYIALIFVVIYGMSAGVYQGFPGAVPYLIIVIFLFMAFVRMYQCILNELPEKKEKKKSHPKNGDSKA